MNKEATASDDELPPLPSPSSAMYMQPEYYTAEQMRNYARAAVSAATKPTADLSKLMQWKPTKDRYGNPYMFPTPQGGWVLFADVQSLLATKPAAPAVPEGAAIDAIGTTYHNIAEIYHQAEECEALHMWLDEQGVPRADAEGKVLSPVGRVMGMAQDAARFRWLNADHDDAEVREQARSLAKRLGISSYFAITRDIDAAMLAAAPAATPAAQDQADQWISVEDARKPAGRTPILVSVSFVRFGEYEDGTPGEWPGQIVAEGEYVPQHGEAGDYFTCYSSPHGDMEGITHWMPLPAAPKSCVLRTGEGAAS